MLFWSIQVFRRSKLEANFKANISINQIRDRPQLGTKSLFYFGCSKKYSIIITKRNMYKISPSLTVLMHRTNLSNKNMYFSTYCVSTQYRGKLS